MNRKIQKPNKGVWRKISVGILCFLIVAVGIIPFFGSGSGNGRIRLVVDLHGYMPSTSRTPTAEDPDVFNSTYYIAEAFMEENPDVEIVWARTKPVGGLDSEVAQWFTTQIAGGTVPAIAFSWGTHYQDRDWYLPLDEYLDAEGSWQYGKYDTWREVFRDYLWDSSSLIDAVGRTVAVPITVYPGASTGYFYNKDLFERAGLDAVPTTWGEFIAATQRLKSAGYVGVAPWLYFNTTTTFDAWVFQSIMSPSYIRAVFSQVDYDGDDRVTAAEQARGCLEGVFSPNGRNAAIAREMYENLYYYYTAMLEEGWAGVDYNSQWMNGTVGIREEGLWALPEENSNTVCDFPYGVFVAPLVSSDTSQYLEPIEYSEAGPYHPAPDLCLNIMKEAVKDDPEMLDAALRFLKFLSKPENVSLICVENGGVLGAVKGTAHSNLSAEGKHVASFAEFINGKFPIKKEGSWPSGFTDEFTDQLNRYFENWVNGSCTAEEFYAEVDRIQSSGALAFAANMGLDTTSWEIVIGEAKA